MQVNQPQQHERTNMNIILKQNEIEKALRQYLQHQGINMRDKTMTVDFTSGRGTNGLSASIDIEEIEIPGFSGGNVFPLIDTNFSGQTGGEVVDTVAGTSTSTSGTVADTETAVQPATDVSTEEVPVTAPATVAEIEEAGIPVAESVEVTLGAEPTVEQAKPSTTSLFG